MNDEELQAIRDLRATVESQERTMIEGFVSLRSSAESQARSIFCQQKCKPE
jgi:hypothetical protein